MKELELAALVALPLRAPLPEGIVRIDTGGFAAVLTVPAPRLPPATDPRPALARQALVRQKLLEDLMQAGEVLPVAPGTLVTPRDLPEIIALNAGFLAQALAGIDQRAQFQLMVEWREEMVLGRFRDSPELAPLFAAGSVEPAALTHALGRLKDRLALQISALAGRVALDVAELPRETAMLCNHVLLVERADAFGLDSALEDIDAIWPEGLRVRLLGPGPAVSFALVTLEWIGPEALAESAELLGLTGPRSGFRIEAARRRLLMSAEGSAGLAPERVNRAAGLLQAALAGTIGGAFPVLACRREGLAEVVGDAIGRVA